MTTALRANTAIKPLNFLAFFLLALALAWLLATPTPSHHLERVLDAGVLRVATRNGPTTYYEDANGYAGLEYELAARFAESLGVRLELVVRDSYPEILDSLNSGEADLAAAGLVVNEHWLKQMRFGPGFQDISQKLVYKQGRPAPKSVNQLKGELRVQAHSAQAERLLALKAENPELRWTEAANTTADELLAQVLSGELDYTVVDSHELALFRRVNPELAVAQELTTPAPLAWGFGKHGDDTLYARALAFFGELRASGELAQRVDRYYGHLGEFDYVDSKEFLAAVGGTLPKYLAEFREAAAADLDWRLLAAVGYQESMWDPKARSRTGVRGMMMLTEVTAEALGVTRRTDAGQSIRGGAEYLRQLRGKVPAGIKEPDRTWFALAAYNVGWGHLDDARELTRAQGGNPDTWSEVKIRLPLLTQKRWYTRTAHGYARGYEPVRFVDAIRRYHETLSALYTPEGKPTQIASAAKPAPVQGPVAQAAPALKPLPPILQGETPPKPAATTLASAQ